MANDINVQDMFLEKVRKEKSLVAVYFEKIKMLGTIKNYDQFSITLDSNGQDQMVYKQGINYISLQKPKRAFFKPRPGFKPREGQAEGSSEGQSQDGPRKSFTPRPRHESDNRSSDRSPENRGDFRKPDERRFDSQSERRYDSQTSAPYKSNREDSSQKTFNQPSNEPKNEPKNEPNNELNNEPKKVFRVQKPYPPKKS
jgi:host factor-I protein